MDDPIVTLRCVDNKACLVEYRMSRCLKQPVTRPNKILFCPLCGQKAVASLDSTEDYWERLALEYELPANIVKELYAAWNQREHETFYDFVQVMKREAELVSA